MCSAGDCAKASGATSERRATGRAARRDGGHRQDSRGERGVWAGATGPTTIGGHARLTSPVNARTATHRTKARRRPHRARRVRAPSRGDYAAATCPDYQMAAFLMAVVLARARPRRDGRPDGRDARERRHAAPRSPRRVGRVDKHSTGGVGDKVSLVLAPARRLARRRGADDVRPRPRPHRWYPRQARVDPRVPHRSHARPRDTPARAARLRAHRTDRRDRPRRPEDVRAARRDVHGRVDPADRREHHEQEARGRAHGPRARREARVRRVHAGARPRARARADDGRPRRRSRLPGRRAAHRDGPAARPRLRQRARGRGVHRSRCAARGPTTSWRSPTPSAPRCSCSAARRRSLDEARAACDVGDRRRPRRARSSRRSSRRRAATRASSTTRRCCRRRRCARRVRGAARRRRRAGRAARGRPRRHRARRRAHARRGPGRPDRRLRDHRAPRRPGAARRAAGDDLRPRRRGLDAGLPRSPRRSPWPTSWRTRRCRSCRTA